MLDQPVRGGAVRSAGVALPPQSMAGWRRGRPLKRWRWLGVFTPELMLCLGDARVGPLPRRWWAVARPGGRLAQRSTIGRGGVMIGPRAASVEAPGVRIDLTLHEPRAVEVLSPSDGGYIWTAKRAPLDVRGTVAIDGETVTIDGPVGFADESAGYHDRHTAWRWSAGIGTAADGTAVAWNLVDGIHDGAPGERTLWLDGEARELGANAFAGDLSSVAFAEGGRLDFHEWSRRGEDLDLRVIRSRYVQPFGTFTGTLPGGLELAGGHGVMEDHDALW